MTKHMPDVPPANRSPKGPDDPHAADTAAAPPKSKDDLHVAEQGETANVMQNTTNKGYFQGRRMK